MKKRFAFVLALSALLVVATVVVAVYTGPKNRTITTTRWERTICDNYTLDPTPNPCGKYKTVCQCGLGDQPPSDTTRCPDQPNYCYPADYPSPQYSVYYGEKSVTQTLPTASASGNFACSLMGNAGWCRSGASLSVSGSEPVSGYSITRIEGNYDGSVSPSVSCNGVSCSFTPPQGQGTFYYWAVSSYGDTSTMGNMTYKVDTAAPVLSSVSPSGKAGNNGWYVGDVTVSVAGSDPAPGSGVGAVQARVNGGAWQTAPVTITTDGVHTVEGRVVDVAGNVSSNTAVTVRRDVTPPNAHLVIPTPTGKNGWFVTFPTISVSATDATSGVAVAQLRYAFAKDGAVSPIMTADWSATLNEDGLYGLEAWAQDVAGNWFGFERGEVFVDTTPPTLSVTVPPPDSLDWYLSDVPVTVSASDALCSARTRIRVDGGAWQPGNAVTINTDGIHTVEIEAEDCAGNVTATSRTIKRDTTPPVLSASVVDGIEGNDGWYRGGHQGDGKTEPVTVVVSAVDDTSGVSMYGVKYGYNLFQTFPVMSGVYSLPLYAKDQAGNEVQQTFVVKNDSSTPNVEVYLPESEGIGSCAGQPVYRSSSVLLDGSAYDMGGEYGSGLRSVTIRVLNNADNSVFYANQFPVKLTREGQYYFEITAEDVAGNTFTTNGSLTIDRTPPYAVFVNTLPDVLSGEVELVLAGQDVAPGFTGLVEAQLSLDGGSTWEDLPLDYNHLSTIYTWDTTQSSGGEHELLLRVVDGVGHETVVGKTVLVSNAAPSAEITAEWRIDQSGQVSITPGDLPIKGVCLTITDEGETHKAEWCGTSLSDIPNPVRWNGVFDDGTRAIPGVYTVTVRVWDILDRVAQAVGRIIIPAPTPTPTPMPTPTPAPAQRQEPPASTSGGVPQSPIVFPPLPTKENEPLPPYSRAQIPAPRIVSVPVVIETVKTVIVTTVKAVRSVWAFVTLIGLAVALGYATLRDERPQAVRRLAERMNDILNLHKEEK